MGWGEASLSCLKDGGAGEVGLGAQTAACVGGDVLRCPPPGSPRSDVWVPPLSLPGLVAAWPDSPGLLSPPPPAALPWAGGCSARRALVLCPGKGLWGQREGSWLRSAAARVSGNVCISVCVSVLLRGRCGAGADPRESGGAGQLACVHGSGTASTRCVAFLLFVSLCGSSDLLCPQAQNSWLQGLRGPVAWAVEQDGELGEGGKGFLPPPPQSPPRPPGHFRSLS